MSIRNWIKKNTTALSIAMMSVDKTFLNQKGDGVADGGHHKKMEDSDLLRALIKGEVNQEVRDLRWRTYKILKEASNVKVETLGFDENGLAIQKITRNNNNNNFALRKVKLDPFDDYPAEMVFDTSSLTTGVSEALVHLKDTNSAMEYFSKSKIHSPIEITRSSIPKFNLEDYTTKLCVRVKSDTERLLEFYVSKYPNLESKTSNLFLGEIKKIFTNPRISNVIDLEKISFTSYKTVGVADFLFFDYKVTGFDKVVEHDGSYILKFNCEVVNNGTDILEKFREVGLDIKYENKEMKKANI